MYYLTGVDLRNTTLIIEWYFFLGLINTAKGYRRQVILINIHETLVMLQNCLLLYGHLTRGEHARS